MRKKALITGINGQDGAYLAKLLLNKGYEVYGAYRRCSTPNTSRLDELGIGNSVRLIPIDMLEFSNILRELDRVKPDEVYNLAAQSFVGLSFEQPLYTSDVDALGVMRLLEAIRTVNPCIRLYQASTSEMFGKAQETPQTESTPFHPRSPYGIAKLFAHWTAVNYREAYNMHVCCGILFNHESPLRGIEFVTRKITASLARIYHGQQDVMELGYLDAKRDWGFAGDYVNGMWLMLQQEEPDNFVLASGEARSIREFVEQAAAVVGYEIAWEGEGQAIVGVNRKSNQAIVRVNPTLFRPAEVDGLRGDSSKARRKLGWIPKVTFQELVSMMVEQDMQKASKGLLPRTI